MTMKMSQRMVPMGRTRKPYEITNPAIPIERENNKLEGEICALERQLRAVKENARLRLEACRLKQELLNRLNEMKAGNDDEYDSLQSPEATETEDD